MPYKIYTYADPYRIAETDFWQEISGAPHLCSSRTLVNGLVNVMEPHIASLLCPLDELIESPHIFQHWTNNIGLKLQQFGYLTSQFDRLHAAQRLEDCFYGALNHNKSAMLDALRLFVELDISATSLHREAANKEQRLFIWLLSRIQATKEPLFAFPQDPSLATLRRALIEKASQEKTDFETRSKADRHKPYYQKRLAMYARAKTATEGWNGKQLVVHGVHQFSAVQLRFLTAVEKLGVEIVFLHNYQESFPAIYSSWDYIYQYFGASVHHDANIRQYSTPGQLPTPGHALGEALGLLCEDGISKNDVRFQQDYALYNGTKILCFENISDYAGYVADQVDKGRQSLKEAKPLYSHPHQTTGTAAVLSHMEELVYTANKDVEELLQLYFPEYSHQRHFLAYPIGQFFAALYRLWDWQASELSAEFSSIRECLNSGLLTKYPAAELLKTSMHLEPLFQNVKTCSELLRLLKEQYLPRYHEVQRAMPDATAFSFKAMTIYQPYKVSEKNIRDFMAAIEELDTIAKCLFRTDDGQDYLSFQKHFHMLEELIRERQAELLIEGEQTLIDQLLARFESVQRSAAENNMGGTFKDLQNGIYFFLKQKEEPDPNWLVKNFEQIDGDILSSKQQNQLGQTKTYHFACVSDRDMNPTVNESLPWPLNDRFIETAYAPVDLSFQVYYAALCERSNFLRYCLFYGLFYNQCACQLSFVRQYNDEETEAYNLLQLLGVETENHKDQLHTLPGQDPIATSLAGRPVTDLSFSREALMDVFLCPYRFLLDYVLNPRPCVSGDFLYANLFENVLVERIWKKLEGKPVGLAASLYRDVKRQESDALKPYFPFWRNTDFEDLIRRADNYFIHNLLPEGYQTNRSLPIRPYSPSHMEMRKLFSKATFVMSASEDVPLKPLGPFQELLRYRGGKVTYPLHQVPKPDAQNSQWQRLTACVLQYLNTSSLPEERVGVWCQTCDYKDLCLRSYTPKV